MTLSPVDTTKETGDCHHDTARDTCNQEWIMIINTYMHRLYNTNIEI
jgi:hypothetical protein